MADLAEKWDEGSEQPLPIRSLSDENIRYEQIGKVIYLMASPSRLHEVFVSDVIFQFMTYLQGKPCLAYPPTLGLDLKEFVPKIRDLPSFQEYFEEKIQKGKEEQVYLYPDISVIFDKNDDRFGSHGYKGVPKLIVEVYSPSTGTRDLTLKKEIYEAIGVPEYWVIQDIKNVAVFVLKNGKYVMKEYQIKVEEDVDILEVPASVFPNLVIKFDKNKIV